MTLCLFVILRYNDCMSTSPYYTVQEVADLYGVAPVTVAAWIRRGRLIPSFRWGGKWGMTAADLDAFEVRRRGRVGKVGKGNAHPAMVCKRTQKKLRKSGQKI